MITILHHLRHLRIKIETTLLFIGWMALGQTNAALAAVDRGSLLSLHNQARTAAGLTELAASDQLNTAAQNKVNDMLNDQYFAHTSPDGVTPWNWIRGAGYVYDSAGENLAIDFFSTSAVFDAWMNSSGHRANILNGAYSEVGFGIAEGEFEGRQTTLVAVTFGHRVSGAEPSGTTETTETPRRSTVSGARSYTPPPDTTAPVAPSILTPATDELLATGTCQIVGEAEPGCTVKIYNGETLVAETTADQSGNFSIDIATPDGTYNLTATTTDASGNTSEAASAVTFTVDTTTPLAPAILTPTASAILATSTSRVTGDAEAGSTVGIYQGERLLGETTADQNGKFTIDITTPDGDHEISAAATDRAGNRSVLTASIAFSVDTLPPQISAETPIQVSAHVMADQNFLARVQVAEAVTGLQGVAHIGSADFVMQPNAAEQSFDLTSTAPAITSDKNQDFDLTDTTEKSNELTIAFTLTDAAGNTVEIPATTISVLEKYAATTRQLPLEQIFWETATDPNNKPVQFSAYAAGLLGVVEIGFAISKVKSMPALSRKYHAVAQYAMAGITAILFIKH